MFNYLGKLCLFAYVVLCLIALAWSAGLYLQFTDWGWKEPRQDLDTRIPSEFDKSMALVKQAVRSRDVTLAYVKPAQDALIEAERYYPTNHLFYIQELEKLRGEPLVGKGSFAEAKEAIEVKALKVSEDGKGPAIPLNKALVGRPELADKIEGLDKTLVAYRAELEKVKEETVKVEKDIEKILAETQKITFALTGKDDAGKKLTYGLYELVDAEYQALVQARKEREEFKPQWARQLEEARTYVERRAVLERRLAQLRGALAKGRPGS